MFYRHDYNASSPITYVGRIPIFAVTIIVATYVVGAILARLGLFPNTWISFWTWVSWLSEGSWLHAAIGALLFYIANTLGAPITGWWVLDMVFLYIFGKELEQHLGRLRFTFFYLGLYFVAPLVYIGLLLLRGSLEPASGLMLLAPNNPANLAVFIAFAAVYPNAQLLLGVPAKFWAWGLLAFKLFNWQSIYTLGLPGRIIPLNDLGIAVFSTFLFAWFMMRGRYQLSAVMEWIPRPVLIGRRFRKARSAGLKVTADPDPHTIIDPLLEKITRDGLSSLSYAERRRLDRARADLLNKSRKDA